MIFRFNPKYQMFIASVLAVYLFNVTHEAKASNTARLLDGSVNSTDCPVNFKFEYKNVDCTVVEGGIVVASKEYSSEAVSDFQSARSRFQKNVGVFNGRIALIVGLKKANELKEFFLKNGLLALIMPTTGERQDMIRAGIMKAIKQMNPEIKPDESEKFVAEAMKRSIGKTPESSLTESSLMQHELCHTWLNVYVHDRTQAGKPLPATYAAYGTRLPDWLDEAVAVSCEDEVDRNRRFSYLQRSQTANAGIPLAQFLKMQHPRNTRSNDQANLDQQKASKSESRMTVRVAIRPPGEFDLTTKFYSQARGIHKFLNEISDKQDILGRIAEEYVRGSDLQAAILNLVKREQRSVSMAEVDALWVQWLASHAQAESLSNAE